MRHTFLAPLIWFLIFIFIILTCGVLNSFAAKNITDLKYEKVLGGPPFSAREKKAKELAAPESADYHGAVMIGSFNILTGNLDYAYEIAAEEAAKLGADYYWVDPESGYQHTKKRYVIDSITSNKIGKQKTTTERYHYEDKPVKGVYVYYCEIYRTAPTKKEQDALRSDALFFCLMHCTNDHTFCSDGEVAAYLTHIKLEGYMINSFFECLVKTPRKYRYPMWENTPKWYREHYEQDFRKLELLLNKRMLSRNIYYAALQMVRENKYSPEDLIKPEKPKRKLSTKEFTAYLKEKDYADIKNLHSDLLNRVEAALTGYKLPQPTNAIESIKAKVTKIKFYEGGYESPEKNERVYTNVFKASNTRYIWWELDMECPPLESKEYISLESVIRTVYGNEYGRLTRAYWVYPKTTSFWLATGWGAENAGTWKPGTYSVELYIDGEFTAIGKFTVN
jgi:hypothetical protein